MIDKADQLYVIDFGHVAFLPSSFATYAFRSVSKPLAHMIMDKVPVPESSNLQAMYRASYIFVIGSSRVGECAPVAVQVQIADKLVFDRT